MRVTSRLAIDPNANFAAKNAEIGAIPGKLGYFRSVAFDRKSASNRRQPRLEERLGLLDATSMADGPPADW